MTPEYPQEVIAPTGLTERKWRLVRQQCRVEACETGVNVLTLYARENVLTPREKASLTSPELDAKRKNWRIIKRLEAENARLREALENVLAWQNAVDVCAPELGGLLLAMYRARAVLAEHGEK